MCLGGGSIFVFKLSPFEKARSERVRQDTFSRLNRDIATISRAAPGTMTRCQAHENACGVAGCHRRPLRVLPVQEVPKMLGCFCTSCVTCTARSSGKPL